MKTILLVITSVVIAAFFTSIQAADRTWDGLGANPNWTNSVNWGNETPPGNKAGGSKFDRAIFGTKVGGALDPTHNVKDGNEVTGLQFQDEWTLTLSEDIILRDNSGGIDVNIPGIDGTVTINGSSGRDVLWFDNPTNTIAAGDTVILNRGWEALTAGQDHKFNGGGTFIFNGSFASGNKEQDNTQFDVEGNTTLVANTTMRLGIGSSPATALDINAGSTLAGTGGLSAGGSGGGRGATISGTLSPGWNTTEFATFNFDDVGRVDLDGTFQVGIDVAGNTDALSANILDLGASSILEVLGTGGADFYIIADYNTLIGTFDLGSSILPNGYSIDYNYLGGNQIALVIPEPGTAALLTGFAALGILVIRRRR